MHCAPPSTSTVTEQARLTLSAPAAVTDVLLNDDDDDQQLFRDANLSLRLEWCNLSKGTAPSVEEGSNERAVFSCVEEAHPSLEPLCRALEAIFMDGLHEGHHTPFGFIRTCYWDWMSSAKDR